MLLQLQIFNAQPELPRFDPNLLSQLQALDSKIRRKGLDVLEPDGNRLISIGTENDGHRVTKNSYGVLNLSWQAEKHGAEWAHLVNAEIASVRSRIQQAHKSALKYLIWAGMGGSAEDKSAYLASGLLSKGVRCYILDSTDPAKLDGILHDILTRSGLTRKAALERTLVVGMAMGMTSFEPVVNLKKLAALYDAEGISSEANFLYLTLPDSLLDKFGIERGYRRVPLQLDNGNTTAGRHSSPLTRGSLYPLALAGVDLARWIAAAVLDETDIEFALAVASFLDNQGRYGRDKIMLLLPDVWKGVGIWTKQDFEESLGKSEELGLKIVVDDPLALRNFRTPKDPKQDRVFLCVRSAAAPKEHADKVLALRRAGYPVAVLTFPKKALLSTYMQFMHYVVFGMGWLRDMNFVTQPSVELYKQITSRISDQRRELVSASSTKYGRNITLDSRFASNIKGTAPEALAAWITTAFAQGSAEYGELTFFGDTRYSAPGKQIIKILDRAGTAMFRALMKAPVDVYEGPAMNHSYHEMIIGHGRCLSIVLISENTAAYHETQFLATQMALAERGRSVVSIILKDLSAKSLADLDELFRETAAAMKNVLKHPNAK